MENFDIYKVKFRGAEWGQLIMAPCIHVAKLMFYREYAPMEMPDMEFITLSDIEVVEHETMKVWQLN